IMMNDANVNPFYNESEVRSTLAVQIPDLPFVVGHFYATRITAYSEEFVYPEESAQSNIIVFQYTESDLDCGQAFEVEPIYPAPNSIVPFGKIVPVVKYLPYCDGYEKFTYNT